MPELIAGQRTDQWREARRGKITASLAGAVLGIDPHKGPLAAFNEIMGIKVQKDNGYMAWGRDKEARARREYEAESGNIVLETGFWTHPELDFLGASPDGLIGANAAVEIKCPQNLPETVPLHHEAQMRVQLACTDREWCDYFAWTPDGHWLHRITRDPRKEADIIDKLTVWFHEHVVTGIAPGRRRKSNP